MAEPVADDILRSGYERWRRLEEEKEAIGSDLKELMAELKGQGFTPKALRESFRRVRNAGDAAVEEHDALVELYVASLTRGTRERAREIVEEIPAVPGATVAETAMVEGGLSVTHSQAKASTGNGATEQAFEAPADSVSGEASRLSGGSGTAAFHSVEAGGASIDHQGFVS